MRAPIVAAALLVTAAVSFLAGRLLRPTDVKEVHHFYLPVPIPRGTIDPDLDRKLRHLMNTPTARPTASPGAPATAVKP